MSRLAEAVADGDEQAMLRELRRIVAARIDDAPPARDLAALSRQMLLIAEQLRAADAAERESGPHGALADLQARRWEIESTEQEMTNA